jgi:hypothetical protein
MVRAARHYHARFAPADPPVDEAGYRALIRRVLRRSARRPGAAAPLVVIPGHDSLRALSGAMPDLLKAECGGMWRSYAVRSHWRMIHPVSREHQARMARQLVEAFPVRWAPVAHLVRFPPLSINHGILLFDVEETARGLRFAAYDPNAPGAPAELTYDRAARTFAFARNSYWRGGPVDVIEAYRGGLY